MIQDLMNTFENPNDISLINVIKKFKDHKMLDIETPDNILCGMDVIN